MVLHGGVRQPKAVGGRLLRPGRNDGGDHRELADRCAPGGTRARMNHTQQVATLPSHYLAGSALPQFAYSPQNDATSEPDRSRFW